MITFMYLYMAFTAVATGEAIQLGANSFWDGMQALRWAFFGMFGAGASMVQFGQYKVGKRRGEGNIKKSISKSGKTAEENEGQPDEESAHPTAVSEGTWAEGDEELSRKEYVKKWMTFTAAGQYTMIAASTAFQATFVATELL